MRLLEIASTGELSFTKDLVDDIPPYAILSHTWGIESDEVTLAEIRNDTGKSKTGYKKLEFCGKQALQDDLRFFWADTCCIDQVNLVELSEAITSIFRWYRNAAKCYVYLSDVSAGRDDPQSSWETAFRRSRWFTRGWTLQELLAPEHVEFFSKEGGLLGTKKTLEQQIHEITGIPKRALNGSPLSEFSVGERMRWTVSRNTKKKEDRAYCLLGIFDVSMSLRYGEGEKAFVRLENKVDKSSKNSEVITWLAPVRSEESQVRVSAARSPKSGLSFVTITLQSWLRDEAYQNSLLWITAGSGKSTLFSLAVENIRTFASETPATFFAYYYCVFSDPESQHLINLLGSVAAQVSAWQPGILDDLRSIFEKDKAKNRGKTLQTSELEVVLVKYITKFKAAIISIDALDESADFLGCAECILRLLKQLPNLKIMVTSTRRAMKQWPRLIEVEMQPDEDIQSYVETKISEHAPLCNLSLQSKDMVKSMLVGQADQSFRWVCLTMDNLCRQRTGRDVMKALKEIPPNLNETYASMLHRIPIADQKIARETLLWLSFAMRSLTLAELSEAAVLEDFDTTLDEDSRLHDPEVILEICHGFVEHDGNTGLVKLAHASVKEYLVTEYARSQGESFYGYEHDASHRSIMRKCLTYLMFDDFRSGFVPLVTEVEHRQRRFPLLAYATSYWGLHAASATSVEWWMAHSFFETVSLKNGGNYGAWVNGLYYRFMIESSFARYRRGNMLQTQPLYYAASFGFTPIVRYLALDPVSTNLDHPGGRYGSTALQVACFRKHREIFELLLVAGADFWSDDPGSGEPALYWAQVNGWIDLVAYMLDLRPELRKNLSVTEEEKTWAQTLQNRDEQKYGRKT